MCYVAYLRTVLFFAIGCDVPMVCTMTTGQIRPNNLISHIVRDGTRHGHFRHIDLNQALFSSY